MPCGATSLLRDGRGLSLTELVVTLALFALVMVGVVGTWGKAQEAYFVGSESAEVQQNVRAAIDFMVREIRSAGRDATVCAFDYATSATVDCDGVKVTRTAPPGSPGPAPRPGRPTTASAVRGAPGSTRSPSREATATTLRIRSDRNHNGRIAGRGNAITSPASAADRGEEDVLYALSTANCPPGVPQCITRDDGTGPWRWWRWTSTVSRSPTIPGANFGPCAGVANPCNIAFGLPLTSQAQADNIGRIRISVQAQQQIGGQMVSRTLVTEVTLRNRS